jgi:hypothetical protein
MRFLLGIIVGVGLTIGGAYIYDSSASGDASASASENRPMVNWDVVDQNWRRATARMRQEWDRIAAK